MGLSSDARTYLTDALTNAAAAKEIADAIDKGVNISQAADIAAFGSTTNIPTSNVTLSTTDTYTDAAVKTAIDSAANGIRTGAESRLDAIEAKINAILDAMKTAKQMA